MTPTATKSRWDSVLAATGGFFVARNPERGSNELPDCLRRRRDRRRDAAWLQRGVFARARHGISLRDAVRERHRFAGDGIAGGDIRLQKRNPAAHAAFPHHRHSRRLHHLLDLLARHPAALRTRRDRNGSALRAAVDGAVDRWIIRGARAGEEFHLVVMAGLIPAMTMES